MGSSEGCIIKPGKRVAAKESKERNMKWVVLERFQRSFGAIRVNDLAAASCKYWRKQ
jgi:hypothetical protein